MKKTKIYATGNENISGDYNVSYYIFEKDESFLNWLARLLEEVIEIKDGQKKAKFIVKNKHDENPIEEELIPKDIHKMLDIHEHYSNGEERIDLFYGKERVYVTFRKSKDIRKRFAKFLLNTKEWIDIKEINHNQKFEVIHDR